MAFPNSGVGVFSGVVLNAPEVGDYQDLKLTFVIKAAKAEDKPVTGNVLDFMNEEVETTGGGFDQENRISIYPLKSTDYKGEAIDAKAFQEENTKLKQQLEAITKFYGVELVFNPFEGMTPPTSVQDVLKDEVLEKVSGNYFQQFIKAMEKADLTKPMRVIFPRKSKNSKYPGLRRNLLKDFPFLESMEVPQDQSKLKFTNSEVKNGLDKPLEVTPDANTGGDVSSLFGAEAAPAGDLGLPFGS